MRHTIATKTQGEKDDERAQPAPAPRQKPPRYDRRTPNVQEKDPDVDWVDDDLRQSSVLEKAICLVAMRMRGINPSVGDVIRISSEIAQIPTYQGPSDAASHPVLARVVLDHLDRMARYRRIAPKADGTGFEQVDGSPPRDEGGLPAWEPYPSPHLPPEPLTSVDLNNIIRHAKGLLDPERVKLDREAAYRDALDYAIWTFDEGLYAGKVDAPTYLQLLNQISHSGLDLATEVYVPSDVRSQSVGSDERTEFDPFDWWGEIASPAVDPDPHKDDAWKKHFEHAGPIQHDADEPYMAEFGNPWI